MPNIYMTIDQLQGLITTLECARDEAIENGDEDCARGLEPAEILGLAPVREVGE